MQSGICPFEAKNNIFSLANFFTENLLPRNVDIGYVFHRNNIYCRFYDMLTDIWYGTGCAESIQNATDPDCQ